MAPTRRRASGRWASTGTSVWNTRFRTGGSTEAAIKG